MILVTKAFQPKISNRTLTIYVDTLTDHSHNNQLHLKRKNIETSNGIIQTKKSTSPTQLHHQTASETSTLISGIDLARLPTNLRL